MIPGQHLLVDGYPGLRLVCTETRKTWTYRYKLGKQMKQTAIGHWPKMQLHEAIREWGDLKGGGVSPPPKIATYTVRQVLDDYIDGHLKPSRTPDSLKAAVRILDKAEPIANMPATSISRAVAFDLLEAHKDKPMAATKLRSLLAGAWDYALDAGRLHEDVPNRWRVVMKGRLKSKGKTIGGKHVGVQKRVLSTDEVATLLQWLPNMHEVGRDATIMYLWTATRGGESLKMQAEHVTEEKDGWWWTVPKAMTKNAKVDDALDLRVPLHGRALEVVKRRLGQTPMFQSETGGLYTQRLFSTYIYSLQPHSTKNATLRCPVINWTPHNLRRTARTLLASLGCSDQIGEAILGHVPEGEIATYNSHTYDKERREWLLKLSDHLDQLSNSQAAADPQ